MLGQDSLCLSVSRPRSHLYRIASHLISCHGLGILESWNPGILGAWVRARRASCRRQDIGQGDGGGRFAWHISFLLEATLAISWRPGDELARLSPSCTPSRLGLCSGFTSAAPSCDVHEGLG